MLHRKRPEISLIDQIEIGSERAEIADFIASKESNIEGLVVLWTSKEGTTNWQVLRGTPRVDAMALLDICKFDIMSEWLCTDCGEEDEDKA